jgi:hypothetical protein
LGRFLLELKLKIFVGNVTFLECSKEKTFKKKMWKLFDLWFLCEKGLSKILGHWLLYLPSLMTPRCSKIKFQQKIICHHPYFHQFKCYMIRSKKGFYNFISFLSLLVFQCL